MPKTPTSDPKPATMTSAVLCVGTTEDWSGALAAALPSIDTHFASFDEVTPELLANVRPSVVLSPLFSKSVDSAELALRLQDYGFIGQLGAVTEPLPKPELIRAELNSLAPDICLDLIFVEPAPTYLH